MPVMNSRLEHIERDSTTNLIHPSSDSIEMDTLDGLRTSHLGSPLSVQYDHHQDIDDNGDDNIALLSGEGAPGSLQWMKEEVGHRPAWFSQAGNIIIEVCFLSS